MIDVENEMCCYTCLNGEYVCDNDTGYHVLCHKTEKYKEPEEICNDFKGSMRNKFKSGDCPCCKTYVDTDDDFKFCGECGQKLGW